MSPSSSDSLSFEQSLAELERILRNLEDGTTGLEESLAQYERGVGLLKGCYQQLRDAEQRIVKVAGIDAEGKPALEPFEHSATVERVTAEEKRRTSVRTKAKESSGEY